MTPLERMAKAYVEVEPCATTWEKISPGGKAAIYSGLRSALLALAEAELDDETIDAAMMSVGEEEIQNMPPSDVKKAPIYFKAILKSIASQDLDVSGSRQAQVDNQSSDAERLPSGSNNQSS